MLLYAAQLLAVAGREYAIVTYSDKMVRQYMKRQQIKERIDVHGYDSVLATLLVHFVVIGDLRVGHVQNSGICDGHAVGIAPDVFEHLTDSLSRRLGIYDPVFVEALLAGGLRDKKSLLLQPACQQIHETPTELTAHSSDGEEKRGASTAMYLMPYAISVNSSAGYNAVDMGVVKKIRSPRMEDGCHTSLESLIVGKSINSAPCGLEHTVVELPLVSHCNGMQTVRHGGAASAHPEGSPHSPACDWQRSYS